MSDFEQKKVFNDINHIMLEMDALTKEELAISEEEKLQLIEKLDYCVPPALTPTPPPCTEDCTCKIPYCCRVKIPENFGVPVTGCGTKESKDLYYKSCLHYVIDHTPCTVTCECTGLPNCPIPSTTTLTLFPIRVVGCIQYHANAKLKVNEPNEPTICHVHGTGGSDKFKNPDTAPRELSICCRDCVCVDKVVGYTTDPHSASVQCGDPIPCDRIQASFEAGPTNCVTGIEDNEGTVYEFKGQFKLIDCPIN